VEKPQVGPMNRRNAVAPPIHRNFPIMPAAYMKLIVELSCLIFSLSAPRKNSLASLVRDRPNRRLLPTCSLHVAASVRHKRPLERL
jgi:hypothetical protein